MKLVSLYLVPFLLAVVTLVFDYPTAVAQTTYEIRIPSGAVDRNYSHFWENQKDGSTTGDIKIRDDDSVVWSNADTAAHTVTSGTPQQGPDGIFDSGLIPPGESFIQKFDELGNYPYFCVIHPWMAGTVYVVKGFEAIPDVGLKASNGQASYEVEYKFNRLVSLSSINVEQKSVTFELLGHAKSDDHRLTMNLPLGVIEPPFVIWVDGEEVEDYTVEQSGDINTLTLNLTKNDQILTIVGSSVVPEFGTFTITAFAFSVVGAVVLYFRYSYRLNIRTI